jgi:hypothetical protein
MLSPLFPDISIICPPRQIYSLPANNLPLFKRWL